MSRLKSKYWLSGLALLIFLSTVIGCTSREIAELKTIFNSRYDTADFIRMKDHFNPADMFKYSLEEELRAAENCKDCYFNFYHDSSSLKFLILDSDSIIRIIDFKSDKGYIINNILIYNRRIIRENVWLVESLADCIGSNDIMDTLSGKYLVKLHNGYAIGNETFIKAQKEELQQCVFKFNLIHCPNILYTTMDPYSPEESFYFSDGPDRKIIISFLPSGYITVTYRGLTDRDFFYELYKGGIIKESYREMISIEKLIYSSRSVELNKNSIPTTFNCFEIPYSRDKKVNNSNAFPNLLYVGNSNYKYNISLPGYLYIGDFVFQRVDNSLEPENGSWLFRNIEKESDLPPLYRTRYQELLKSDTSCLFGPIRMPKDYKLF